MFGPIRRPEPALYARLRRQPSPHSVTGSLPVLFFGDIFSAQIATLGINPSWQEYLDPSGHELTGSAKRFETLTSLGAPSRAALTDEQCERAIHTMRGYFQPGKSVYHWFRSLDHVIRAMGYCYTSGSAVNLDLVQEATAPTWSALTTLAPTEASTLVLADRPFLQWQLEAFSISAVVCNGKTPLRHACALLDAPLVDVDSVARGQVGRVTWYATGGHISGRALAVVGWNLPLARPTGLTTQDNQSLGKLLATALKDLGTCHPDSR